MFKFLIRCQSRSIFPEFWIEARNPFEAVERVGQLFQLEIISEMEKEDTAGIPYIEFKLGNGMIWIAVDSELI